MEVKDIINALDSLVWYFNLDCEIVGWIRSIDKLKDGEILTFRASNDTLFVWTICVLLFGDYGTSPASGWIVKTKECKEFLKQITRTQEIVFENGKETEQ